MLSVSIIDMLTVSFIVDFLLTLIAVGVIGGACYFIGRIVFKKTESALLTIVSPFVFAAVTFYGLTALYNWGLSVGRSELGESQEYNLVCTDSDAVYNLVCANSNINNGVVVSSDARHTTFVTVENGYIFHEYVRRTNKNSEPILRDSYVYYTDDNGAIKQVRASKIDIDPEIKNPTKIIATARTTYVWNVIPNADYVFEIIK